MQRFKALELAVDQRDWTLACHLKLGAAADGLASLAEKEEAAHQAILQHTLNGAVKPKVGTKSHQDGVGTVGHGALPS